MYQRTFIHSSTDGYLGCFHTLAIVNNAAANTPFLISYDAHAKPVRQAGRDEHFLHVIMGKWRFRCHDPRLGVASAGSPVTALGFLFPSLPGNIFFFPYAKADMTTREHKH